MSYNRTIYHFDPSNLPPKSLSGKPPTQLKPSINNNNSANGSKHQLEKQKSLKMSNESEDLDNNKTEISDVQNVIDENEISIINVITDTDSLDTKECDEG